MYTSYLRKPFGKRTKSPGELILDLIQTKAANDLAKTQAFQAKYVSKVDIKKRFIQGGLALHFELKPGAAYKVSSEGKQIKIRFFKSTSANAKISQFAAKQKKSSGKQLRIIIDPGHGGEDSGAVGKNGSKEKDVVLQISKRLAADLRRKLNAKVYLTRSWDKTLTLEERNTFAKNKAADLFLSVHANASPKREVSGIQTYYLNNATDQASIRLAKRENRNSHQKLPKEKHVLSTMLQNYATEESHLLAKQVQNSLIKSLSKKYKDVHDLNVRSALFYVLVGAKCPGVLIETSFISNPREEQRLQNSRYQAALSSAITDGVAQYLRQQSKQRETL